MDERTATRPIGKTAGLDVRRHRPMRSLWKSIREPLAKSRAAAWLLTSAIVQYLRLVKATTVEMPGSVRMVGEGLEPGIVALWHGQHLLTPVLYPKNSRPLVAMVSRSADAEIIARVIERFGIEAVRGSGGRENARHLDKGGARALVALKKALDAGKNVAMIADIPHGRPRQSGAGIVLLARLSGRPIVGFAVATSRRKVLQRSWDKTTINLPFGRRVVVATPPITVSPDADETEMERKRQELTAALNAATAKAYSMIDGAR